MADMPHQWSTIRLLRHPSLHRGCRYTGHTLAKFFVTLATGLVTGLTAAACAATLEFVFWRKQLAVQWMINIVKHKALLAGFGLHLLITTSLLMFAACMVSARNTSFGLALSILISRAHTHWQQNCQHAPSGHTFDSMSVHQTLLPARLATTSAYVTLSSLQCKLPFGRQSAS